MFHGLALATIAAVMGGMLLCVFLLYRRMLRRVEASEIAARKVDDARFWQPCADSPKPGAVCVICLAVDGAWGRSACCHSDLHPECTRMYFKHQDRVSCPICRWVYV